MPFNYLIHIPANLAIFISGEIHSSKNSRQVFKNKKTGKTFVSKSKSAKADESMFADQLEKQKPLWDELMVGHEYPIVLVFTLRRKTKREFDYNNLIQGVLDAMVKAEYIPDDSMLYVLPFPLPWRLDKQNPGCHIQIGTLVSPSSLEQILQPVKTSIGYSHVENAG